MSLKRQAAYQKGLWAEELAAKTLKSKGYKILETRYKTKFGEVDLIAKDQDAIVFVEVKARKTIDDGLYAVSAKSQERIQNAALHFMAEHAEYGECGMRFDVIAVGEKGAGGISVSHLDNAWMAGA